MVASSGDLLLQPDAVALYRERLIPLATLVTPNLHEAVTLANRAVQNLNQLEQIAQFLAQQYRTAFLVKGGHLGGTEASDVFVFRGQTRRYSAPFRAGLSTHGTGCTLSAAITANLALEKSMEEAIRAGKEYVTRAIAESWRWDGAPREVTALKHW
jgi:hydroxymethylpyrimidine/phosphomethylpyrimidine kinase